MKQETKANGQKS